MPKADKKPKRERLDNSAAAAQYEAHRAEIERPTADTPNVKQNNFAAKRSKEHEDAIVEWLEKGYTIGYAADKVGIHRRTLFEWREGDSKANIEFNNRCEAAIERGTDLIEDEARRRATEGFDEPVFQQGACVGFKRVYSDTLMQTILGGRRAKYGKQKVEHSGPDGGAIHHKIEVEFVDTPKKAS